MQSGVADLVAAGTQIVALEVPAYPRAPDARFDDHIESDDEVEEKPSPFAALAPPKLDSDDAWVFWRINALPPRFVVSS